MGVALAPTLSGWAARVGRITTPPNSKDYVGGLHCMCACVHAVWVLTRSSHINIGNSLIQDNAEEGTASKIKCLQIEVPHKF